MSNTTSILGPIALGKDTTGNFRLSVLGGIAVRIKADGPFYTRYEDRVISINDQMAIAGTENLIYRIPIKKPEARKDVVIVSDDPFSILFVDEVHAHGVKGVDEMNVEKTVRSAFNFVEDDFFVVAAGPDRLLDRKESPELLALMLASGTAGG